MDSSTKKLGGIEIPKRNRSLDLKSLYKSRVSEVGESNKKVSEENDLGNAKKKRKRSIKEVSLSCSESDAKRSRKEDVDGVKPEQGFSRESSGGSKGLHGFSFGLGGSGSAFNFPKRPRDFVGRPKVVTDLVSKPLGLPNSGDRVGTINGKVIKSTDKAGTSNRLVKVVTVSTGNGGDSNSKSAGKVGGSESKVKEETDPKSKDGSNSKIKQKAKPKSSGSDQISGSFRLPKSLDRVEAFNVEVIKPKDEVDTGNRLTKLVTGSTGNGGASNSKFAGEVGGSNVKVKRKVISNATSGSDQISGSFRLPKSLDRVEAFNGEVIKPKDEAGSSNRLTKLVTGSVGNDGASNLKVKGKVISKSTSGSDQISGPFRLPKSIDRVGAFNDEFIKPKVEAGTGNRLVKLVTGSVGNDGASNSKVKHLAGSKSTSGSKKKAEPKSAGGSDQISGSFRLHKSLDRTGAFNGDGIKPKGEAGPSNRLVTSSAGNDGASNSKFAGKVVGSNSKVKHKAEVIEPKGKAGTSDQLVKSVTISVGNDGASNLKSAGKVGDSNSKAEQKADGKPKGGSTSKIKQKGDPKPKGGSTSKINQNAEPKSIGGRDQVSEPLVLPKSVDHSEAFNGKVIRSEDKAGVSDQSVKLVTLSAGNNGASNSKSVGKVGVSNSEVKQKADLKPKGGSSSKIKRKADPKSTVGSNQLSEPLGLPKSVDHAGAFDVEIIKPKDKSSTSDQSVKLVTLSMGNDGASNSNSAGKVGGSNSKIKQKADLKSSSKCGSANTKSKRKAGADELKENKDGRLCSIQHSENGNSEAVNKVHTSSKKRRINSRMKKDLVIGGDGGEASKKKSEPSVGSSVSDSIFIDFDEDDDDEEKLEQNAARMLSSRFDPSCTGFSSKRKSSVSQTVNRFSFPVSSSRDSFPRQANSSSGMDSASADDRSRALRPRKDDKRKGMPRKRRHFYEILPRDLDPHWFLNRRIKVFWPLDASWYYGLVNNYHPDFKLHHIKYDDRDEEWVDLQEEKFKILLLRSEVPGKVKSRKVSAKDNNVNEGETIPPEADASHIGNYLDSEPIALWLARSSQNGLKAQKDTPTELPMVSASSSLAMVDKSILGTINGHHVVYSRKKNHKNGGGSAFLTRGVRTYARASGIVSLAPITGFMNYEKQLWSVDHGGLLRLNVLSVESKKIRVQIWLPVRCSGFSLGMVDGLFRDMLVSQNGVMSTISPAVILEMLFIDSYLGLRFLLFEGCMEQALVLFFLILTMFSQPDEHVNGDMQSPVTSVRLRFSSVHDLRKHNVVELHSFSRLRSSKWASLDFELLQHCVLIKQLQVSECTYDNIKELERGSLKQWKPDVDLESPSYLDCNEKFVPRILPKGVSDEACNTRVNQSASFAAKPGEVPQFALSFSAAPTFFLTWHLQLLMDNSSDMRNLNHRDALSSPEGSENGGQPDAECIQCQSSLVSAQDPRSDSRVGGLIVDVSSCNQVGRMSRQASAVGWNANEGFVHSPNRTGSRYSWQGGRSSSMSSPHGDLSPMWRDRCHSGFSNGPKRPRTQVQYTLPGADYDYSATQKVQNQNVLPCKRIRRASLKRISDVSRSNQKKFELLACNANVLVTNDDKGWRECGAVIVLEVADHNEWRLAIKLSGITKYSYKVKHILQPGSTNRYSHAMLWKGGKDWVLEFPDRSQWTLFKEMHAECYNRNICAASVKNIPIPGVRLIEESDDWGTEVPFIRNPTKYFRQFQTDVEMAMDSSHILYDIDSDDEQWLVANKKNIYENRCEEISEEFFEKIMDMFEKVSYVQHHDKFTDAEIQELVVGMGSVAAAKAIYEHWQEKRERKGMPLIRHLQPPLWERYQLQLKEWEHTVARSNTTISAGNQEKVPVPEKPPMFAFCQKPRGLDLRNKGSKQRSHRKFSVSGHLHAASRDHYSRPRFGRRSNGHTFGDEKVLYTTSVRESFDVSPSIQTSMRLSSPRETQISLNTHFSKSNRNSKAYKNKTRKLGSYTSSSNQQMVSYNQQTEGDRDGVQPLNTGLPGLSIQGCSYFEVPYMPGAENLDGSDLPMFQFQNALSEAEHASKIAKLKREKAQKLFSSADIAIQKAVNAIMTAEAMQAACC